MFAVNVSKPHRGNGYAVTMCERVLNYARENGLKSIRIGGGKSPATNRIHQIFCERATELDILARDGDSVDLRKSN